MSTITSLNVVDSSPYQGIANNDFEDLSEGAEDTDVFPDVASISKSLVCFLTSDTSIFTVSRLLKGR